jgi:hypothetical protein
MATSSGKTSVNDNEYKLAIYSIYQTQTKDPSEIRKILKTINIVLSPSTVLTVVLQIERGEYSVQPGQVTLLVLEVLTLTMLKKCLTKSQKANMKTSKNKNLKTRMKTSKNKNLKTRTSHIWQRIKLRKSQSLQTKSVGFYSRLINCSFYFLIAVAVLVALISVIVMYAPTSVLEQVV